MKVDMENDFTLIQELYMHCSGKSCSYIKVNP